MRRSSVCPKPGCPNLRPCAIHDAGRTRSGNAGTWNPGRDRAAHIRFARVVKKRDGFRCQDCGATTDLRACHIVPVADGGSYDPANGITRCGACDRASDPHAR